MRIIGHGLQDEGAAYSSVRCGDGPCAKMPTVMRLHHSGTGGEGHGLCECGALSEHEDTGNARERWHREHKDTLASKPTPRPRRRAS